jgi:hypothetical protein
MMKKQLKDLPEVHIHGDLQDVKKLLAGLNKKKSLVVFHDGDAEVFYLEIKRKFRPILQNEINQLSKDYRLIYFSFFPSRKKAEPVIEVLPDPIEPEKKKVEKKKKKITEPKGKKEKAIPEKKKEKKEKK